MSLNTPNSGNRGPSRRDLLHYGALSALLLLIGQRVSENLRVGKVKAQIIAWEKEFGPHYRSIFLQKFATIGSNVISLELQEKIIRSVHRIYVDTGRERPSYGTGFFILPNVMVTAKHVVQNREVLGVYGNNGDITRNFQPRAVCTAENNDIAFLIFDTDIGEDMYFDISTLNQIQLTQPDDTIAIFVGYGGGLGENDVGLGSVITALRAGIENYESGNIVDEKIKALFPVTTLVRGGSSGGLVINLTGKLLGNLIATYDHDGRTIMSIGLYEKVESIQRALEVCKDR